MVITGVTIDHIPQELSPSNDTLDTTPKDFAVVVRFTVDLIMASRHNYDMFGLYRV